MFGYLASENPLSQASYLIFAMANLKHDFPIRLPAW